MHTLDLILLDFVQDLQNFSCYIFDINDDRSLSHIFDRFDSNRIEQII